MLRAVITVRATSFCCCFVFDAVAVAQRERFSGPFGGSLLIETSDCMLIGQNSEQYLAIALSVPVEAAPQQQQQQRYSPTQYCYAYIWEQYIFIVIQLNTR